MYVRGPVLAASALVLVLAFAACDSSDADSDHATAGSATTASIPATPNAARRLDAAPSNCSGRRPRTLVSFGNYGNLIGSSPVWAGLYAIFDKRRGAYHVQRDAPRNVYGWRIKVLWVVTADVEDPVRVVGTDAGKRARLWFEVNERDERPVRQATLDPATPGVPLTGDDYVEFPSYVYIPRAGCYSLEASWPGGSWRLVVGLGR